MEQMKQVLEASWLWRILSALCLWCGRQWQNSGVVQWFLHPALWEEAASRSSVLVRLWEWIWGGIHKLYAALHLEKLFSGSVFLQSGFWCALPMVLAPLLPTMAALGLVLAAYCSTVLSLLHSGKRRLVYSPINKYLLLYAAVYLVAAFLSVNFKGSLQPTLLAVFFTLFPLAVENCVDSHKSLENISACMVLSGTVVAVIGIGQYVFGITGAESWVDSDMFSSITVRVYSTLQNPNVLAEYLLLIIPLGVALLLTSKTWGRRIVFLGCCGLLCLCMILTFSRGGWLGLLIAAGVFVLLLEPRLLMLAPFALIALYFVMPETVITRLTSVGDLKDTSTSYRFSIWMGSIAMLKDYWLCGVGPGTAAFNQVYPAYSYNAANAQHAHNLYLQMVADGGVCLLILFIVLLIVLFRHMCARMTKERRDESRIYLIAVLSGITGFLAQGMTDYSFYNYRVVLVFWAVVGLGAAWVRVGGKGDKPCSL